MRNGWHEDMYAAPWLPASNVLSHPWERVVNALGRKAEVECIIRGVSADAAGMLRLRNTPRGEVREFLVRWLADNYR